MIIFFITKDYLCNFTILNLDSVSLAGHTAAVKQKEFDPFLHLHEIMDGIVMNLGLTLASLLAHTYNQRQAQTHSHSQTGNHTLTSRHRLTNTFFHKLYLHTHTHTYAHAYTHTTQTYIYTGIQHTREERSLFV